MSDNKLSIEEVSIKQFEQEIKELSDKYDTYIQTNNNIETIRTRFKRHFRDTHHNIEVEYIKIPNMHPDSILRKCDTYADYENELNKFVGDSKEMRINQLIDKFRVSRLHFKSLLDSNDYNDMYKLSESNATIDEILKEIDKTSKKRIVLNVVSLENQHRTKDTIGELLELFKLMFDIDIKYDMWNKELQEHEKIINSMTNEVKLKFFLNGNIYVTFKDDENRKMLIESMKRNVVKWVTYWRNKD